LNLGPEKIQEFWGRVLKAVDGDRKDTWEASKWLLAVSEKVGVKVW